MWAEEDGKGTPTFTDAAGEMRSAGLSAAGIEGDLGSASNTTPPEDMEGLEQVGEQGPLAPGAASTMGSGGGPMGQAPSA